ncbi:MAG TPA: ubiquitin-like small modifier protein 1 [Actinomycetes bacterium]|nr:ubiquitin-like small modifier protein 1 [Actinomycetes bacterium]
MPTVHLPAALGSYAGGQRRVRVELEGGAGTVATVLEALAAAHPGVRQRVLDERGTLRPHVNVFVNDESVRWLAGLDTPVGVDDEIWIIPAVSGGAPAPVR